MSQEIALIIPAYRPSIRLLELVRNLQLFHAGPIVIIDDGSGAEYRSVFDELRSSSVVVLRNAVNLGKGAALKLGMNHVLVHYPALVGVVTADADGQHAAKDIAMVAQALGATPNEFVLGAREFGPNTPLRSKIGNGASRWLYRGLLGLNLTDTQTGLRGLPRRLCEACLAIRSNRYEFETEMLTLSKTLNLPISEVEIETIYEDNNSSSHFNPFFDSLRIYFVVLRYSLSSIGTALVDFAAFILMAPFVPNIIVSNLLSRSVAVFIQFALLRTFVFKADAGVWKFLAFAGYVGVVGIVSGALQSALSSATDLGAVPSKVIVESTIFVFNFLFLRDILFRRTKK